MPHHAQQEEGSQRQSAHHNLQSSNNCPTRSATSSLLIRYSEVGTDTPNDKCCQKGFNIAQQLNSGSRKTRRSSITRQGRNNCQNGRGTPKLHMMDAAKAAQKAGGHSLQTAVFHPPSASRAMMSSSGGNSCTGNTARAKASSNPGSHSTKRVVGFGDTCPYGLWIWFTL